MYVFIELLELSILLALSVQFLIICHLTLVKLALIPNNNSGYRRKDQRFPAKV